MVITYHGDSCVRLTGKHAAGEFAVLIDLYDAKATGLKPLRPSSADLVISTTGEIPSFSEGPYLVRGPGECEVRGVSVVGIPFHGRTIYRIVAEGISIAHLGNASTKLDAGTAELLGEVDICFVPIGGNGVLGAKEAGETIEQLEPRIVIPIQYGVKGTKLPYDGPEAFCKEYGCSLKEVEDRLKIVEKDMPSDETWVRIIAIS
ncbi:MAG: MBL fold metallo-hydrolase [Candidatus Uhrbacteria bacterium]